MKINGLGRKNGLRKIMAQFSENEKQMQEKVLDMLDVVVGLYRNAKSCLEQYDYKGAERNIDAARKIVDELLRLADWDRRR